MPAARAKVCLWFDDQGEEAARYYTSVLRDGSLGRITHYLDPDPTPSNRPGQVLTVEFSVEGIDFVALNGGPGLTLNEAASIQVYRETQAEIDETWDALLADGGTPGHCDWLKDRFGMSWQVIPPILDELTANEDEAVARAATEAMLEMHKIDVERIRAAAGAAGVSS